MRCVRESHPTATRPTPRRQAVPTVEADAAEVVARAQAVTAARNERIVAREGLIYTRNGVLDMTRRPVQRQPMVEKIVVTTGGARIW